MKKTIASHLASWRMYLIQPRFNQLFINNIIIHFQCSKLLADISVIQFYPSKFVLVTDILDTFGKASFIQLISYRRSNMIVKMQILVGCCKTVLNVSFAGKLVYERIFRKSSIFTPGSNIPTMLPGKKSAYSYNRLQKLNGTNNYWYVIFFGGRWRRIKKVTKIQGKSICLELVQSLSLWGFKLSGEDFMIM